MTSFDPVWVLNKNQPLKFELKKVIRIVPDHPHSEVIGLRSRIDEKDHTELFWKSGRQSFSIQNQVVMQKPVVGIEYGHLFLASFDDMIVAVSNMADVIDAIQVLSVLFIVHVLAFGSDDFDRILSEK